MEVKQGLWLPAGSAGCSCRSDVACEPHASHLVFRFASTMADFGGISITQSLLSLCTYRISVSPPGAWLLLPTYSVMLCTPGRLPSFRVLSAVLLGRRR